MPKKINYLSVGKVCLLLDVSPMTVKRWYIWWENKEFEKPKGLYLPKYYHRDRRKTKFFKEEDIPLLEKFRDDLRGKYKGAMSEFNAVYSWGQVGKDKLKENYKITKRKLVK